MRALRIATRKSRLAVWQSEHVAAELSRQAQGIPLELMPLSTRGDEELDRPLAEIGGKGLFLKELEHALIDGAADLAVHSLKDVPTELPAGLELAAYLARGDPADLWLTRDGTALEQLPAGAVVGTSSLRRRSQLLARRPDLVVRPLRGNIETRLRRLEEGSFDALILAAAGLGRLGITPRGARRLEPPMWLSAPGQGVITVECRSDDGEVLELLRRLNCPETGDAVRAERAVVSALGGDCSMPLAALAVLDGDRIDLRARLGGPAGEIVDVRVSGDRHEAKRLGRDAAERILDQGGGRFLAGAGQEV